jgi:hypothetical protein
MSQERVPSSLIAGLISAIGYLVVATLWVVTTLKKLIRSGDR